MKKTMKIFNFIKIILIILNFIQFSIAIQSSETNCYQQLNDKQDKNVTEHSVFLIDFNNFQNNLTINSKKCLNKCPKNPNNLKITKKQDAGERAIDLIRQRVLSINQPFDPSINPNTTAKCKSDTKLYLDSLKSLDLWALQIYDSAAKLPSGLLNGNINQYGDFYQCLKVRAPTSISTDLRGQYCLAYLQVTIPVNSHPRLKKIYKLTHSHDVFISEFNDPGHRVPRFSLINWALCVPSSCTHLDVENSLKDYVADLVSGTGIQFQIRIEPDMCQIQSEETYYDKNTKIVFGFFLLILLISLLSTYIDWKWNKNANEWLIVFSLKRNLNSIFTIKDDTNDIDCIHGMRFFNALLLIFAHKSMAVFFQPYVNRTVMAEALGQPWTVIGRAASIYTDPFLMFSGFLTAFSIVGRLQRQQKPKILQEYIGRFLRIVPTLGALILFSTFLLPHMGAGPQWGLVVSEHAKMCKKYWWRNLLFIHNYFGFENMCLTHTHHLGIDTQLFLVAPLMILLIWKWPKNGVIILLTLASVSTIARFHITVVEKLSNYIYFGTSIQRLFRTADFMYTQPAHRATVYIFGIILGYVLRVHKNWKLTQRQLQIGWCLSFILFSITFFGPAPMGSIHYKYNEIHAAIYAAFGPIAWCFIFGWIIFTSYLGYDSFLNKFFSLKIFQITTRLSYAIYLTQFPVFFYCVGIITHSESYNFWKATVGPFEYIWIILSSTALTVFFDVPFQNIKKLIFRSSIEPVKYTKIIENTQVCKSDKEHYQKKDS